MMKLKNILIALLMCGMCNTMQAQSLVPVLSNIDCGQLRFQVPAFITLELKNTSPQTVQIKKVDTGCGCSDPTFEDTDIQPGQSGKVKISFDCKQLGHFSRSILVYDSSSDKPAEVIVSGQVVTKVENFTGDYPFKFGNLLADVDELEFDDVNKGQRFTKEIHIMNPTGQNVHPVLLRLPSYLKAEMHPETLGPKQSGTMTVTLNSSELRDYGLLQTSVYLAHEPSDKISKQTEIAVSTILLPPATQVNGANAKMAPRIGLSSKEIDMTALSKKKKAKDEITIVNGGRSVLEINKVQLFTSGLEISLGSMRIEPGQSTKLKVTGDAKDLKKTKVRPRILLITNDPRQQKVVIEVKQ